MLHKRRGSTRLVLWGSRRRPSQRSLPTQGLHLSPLQQPALWLQNLLPRLQQYLAWRVASLARVARLPCMQRLEHTAVAQVRSKANEVCWHKDNASASPSQAHTLRTCCQARRLRVDVVISMRVLVHLHSAPPYQGCPLLHMTAGGAAGPAGTMCPPSRSTPLGLAKWLAYSAQCQCCPGHQGGAEESSPGTATHLR